MTPATLVTKTEKPLHADNLQNGHVPTTAITSSTPQIPDETPLAKINSNNLAKITSASLLPPPRSRSPDSISLVSADDFSELRLNRLGSRVVDVEDGEVVRPHEGSASGWRARARKSWGRNKGLALVLMSQLFGVLMNVTTRMLEMGGGEGELGMHPFQVLFARMSITVVLASLYMWYTSVPDFPLGPRSVRALLIARGLGGFFGVFGLYWSLQYLPLADATVLTFLALPLANFVCSKLLHESFTRVEQLGVLVSLAGVVLIARPTSLFSSSHDDTLAGGEADQPSTGGTHAGAATPQQRLAAVGMAMVGVLGAAIAYTTIRWIGTRAHALISVNYFATWCTLVSVVALSCIPSIPFVLPATLRQWTLLFFIGVSGFVMQFLLTAGLRLERGSRATNMVFVQMVFALAFDWGVWGVVPDGWEWVGCAGILGSAIGVAVQKERSVKGTEGGGGGGGAEDVDVAERGEVGEEGVALIGKRAEEPDGEEMESNEELDDMRGRAPIR